MASPPRSRVSAPALSPPGRRTGGRSSRPGSALGLVACLCAGAACTDVSGESESDRGGVAVTIATTGADADLDGYTVVLDDRTRWTVFFASRKIFADLPPGPHRVELLDVAENCQVTPGRDQPAAVARGDTVEVAFDVGCVATGIQLDAATRGVDRDRVTRLTLGPRDVQPVWRP
jgi:hypothetical protein